MAMALDIPRIYPITDKGLSERPTHLSILRELARGGATWVQIRDKQTPVRELLADLRRCVEFSRRHGLVLVVNDRCDLALSAGAEGVHLGQEDLPPAAARELLGQSAVIGYSTHSLSQIEQAKRIPADYLGFGPIFRTATKRDSREVVGLSRLRLACRRSNKPIIAIGGIGIGNVRAVLEAGAASAAVISALMRAPDLARQMEALLKAARERG